MKRRAKKRQARAWKSDRVRDVRRLNDSHRRWELLAFMGSLIETLAREDVGVDQKLAWLAAAARRTSPAIMAKRAALQSGLGEEDK
jgi:hypothetical protein